MDQVAMKDFKEMICEHKVKQMFVMYDPTVQINPIERYYLSCTDDIKYYVVCMSLENDTKLHQLCMPISEDTYCAAAKRYKKQVDAFQALSEGEQAAKIQNATELMNGAANNSMDSRVFFKHVATLYRHMKKDTRFN